MRPPRWSAAALGVLAGLSACAGPERVAIRWPAEVAGRQPVDVRGLAPEELERLARRAGEGGAGAEAFAVFVAGPDAPALSGSYAVEDGTLRFRPRYDWTPGLAYRCVLRLEGPGGPLQLASTHAFPAAPRRPTTRVTAVYPSADVVPENLLRLYVHFSAPMTRGAAYAHVRLLDEEGHALDEPFLPLPQELWDPETTRLTLLLDPGRIKRGLVPHVERGAPLEAGRRYRLVIDPSWRDAEGVPLAEPFERELRTGAADRASPDVRAWELRVPRAGSRDPLVVDLGESLDHALLQRMLCVIGPEGRERAGRARVDVGETRWSWRPDEPWPPGAYTLRADPLLEDLAGNGLARPFEVDQRAGTAASTAAAPLERRFEVAAP